MTTTRQQIIEVLRERSRASAFELSRLLKVTPVDIRHHLAGLLANGDIQVVSEKLLSQRGRPTLFYGLTSQAQEHNLYGLLRNLMRLLLDGVSPAEQQDRLRNLARSMFTEETTRSISLTQRLNRAILFLNERHYQASWEAHSLAPRLRLGNCPYAAILPEFPELCKFDQYLLEAILQQPVIQTARLLHDQSGKTFCQFLIEK